MPHLGGLETRVMGVLWTALSPLSVREVHDALTPSAELAYTTVMTVLDRLAKKQLLSRERDGKAWLYRPVATREELLVGDLLLLLRDPAADTDVVLRSLVAALTDDERARLESVLS